MARRASGLSRGDVLLRAVEEGDLPVFFDQQTDPEANRMAAAFTAGDPTDRDAFMARWKEILANGTITKETILVDGSVIGHVLSFESSGKREVSYWIGKRYWGRGASPLCPRRQRQHRLHPGAGDVRVRDPRRRRGGLQRARR